MKESMISSAEMPAGSALHGQNTPPLRILVVDGDFETRQLSNSVLVHSGYEVDTAADGAVAWRALNAGHYDLLITNYKMPRVSGVELLMKVRASNLGLPVIMASATLPREQFTRYPWLKPTATVLQPYVVTMFLGTVNKILRAPDAPREQGMPSPNPPSQPLSHWFAGMMILLRSPMFR
jgi:two-component system, chemotaxis family, chemotaxis protein CheY